MQLKKLPLLALSVCALALAPMPMVWSGESSDKFGKSGAVCAISAGKSCPASSCAIKDCSKDCCKGRAKFSCTLKKSGKRPGLESGFYRKAHFFLSKSEKLQLKDEQIEKIKTLKVETKKGLITRDAEIKVVALDIKTQLKKSEIDTLAVHALIDRKYDLKKSRTKNLVEAYAKVKAILTTDQKAKAKEIWMGKQKA